MPSRPDWVIQPETWEPADDSAYILGLGQTYFAPLTVSNFDIGAIDQERYREKEPGSTVALCTRGHIVCSIRPRVGSTWPDMWNETFWTFARFRITRLMQDPEVPGVPWISGTPPDMREPSAANDQYVWERIVTWQNVGYSTWVGINNVIVTKPERVIPVVARYQRRLDGLESMMLQVQYGVFGTHSNFTDWWPVPNHDFVARHYLRTLVR